MAAKCAKLALFLSLLVSLALCVSSLWAAEEATADAAGPSPNDRPVIADTMDGVAVADATDGAGMSDGPDRAAINDGPDRAAMNEGPDCPAVAAAAPDDCQSGVCCGCPCGPAGRFWMRADALLWWTKGSRLPPLVTTSPAGTPAFDPQTGTPLAGALTPAANTTVLFGDSVVNDRFRAGPDITMGLWLDCCNTWGIEGDYFDLGRQNTSYDSGLSNGSTILARPFFNTEFGYPDAELAAFPGELAGQVTAQASTEFHSAGFDFRHNLYCQECCPHACECGDGCGGCAAPCCNCCPSSFRLDAIAGYRNYDLSDDLAVEENLITTGGPTQVGTQINVTDSFHTRNAFNGMDLGLIGNAYYGCWSWQVSAKAALGWENQAVTINGSTVVTTPDGTVATSQGGLLALQTNIGTYSRNEFVVIPELGMEVGYQITPHLRGFFGYNFLYWGDVARAGDQVTLNIDPRNLPGAPRTGAGPQPAFTFNDTSFWAQGIRLGAELRY